MQLLIGGFVRPTEEQQAHNADLIAKWQSSPPWGGSEGYRPFFHNFTRAVIAGGAGATVTELYHWTSGETPATVPEIRSVVAEALRDGLIVKQEAEGPHGSWYEAYLINESSPVINAILGDDTSVTLTSGAVVMPSCHDVARNALAQFAEYSIDALARECGFEEGSSLTPDQFIEFFRGGPFTESQLLQSPELYPDGVSYFRPDLRPFIEQLVIEAQRAGVVEQKQQACGRPVYALTAAVSDLFASAF